MKMLKNTWISERLIAARAWTSPSVFRNYAVTKKCLISFVLVSSNVNHPLQRGSNRVSSDVSSWADWQNDSHKCRSVGFLGRAYFPDLDFLAEVTQGLETISEDCFVLKETKTWRCGQGLEVVLIVPRPIFWASLWAKHIVKSNESIHCTNIRGKRQWCSSSRKGRPLWENMTWGD